MILSNLHSRLSRRTSGVNLIPEIDGFRFFAIGTVLLYHLNTHLVRVFSSQVGTNFFDGWLNSALSQGSVGVDVFFSISGFILALPFARHHLFSASDVSLKSYYIRRLTRLEPPYVISLVVFLSVHIWILHEQWDKILPNFFASLFYLHSIVYNEWSKINPVAWSLEVEVQFYLLAPFLAALFAIRRPLLRRLIIVLIIAASIVHYNLNYPMIENLHLRKSLIMHLHQFMIGFLFADFFLTDWREILARKSVVYDIIGILSFSLLLVFNSPFVIYHDLIFCCALFTSFVCLFRGKALNAFFTNSWIVIIGGMCYSIYLLHYALIAFLVDRTDGWLIVNQPYAFNFILQAVLILPVVLVTSAIYFAIIERPCMDKDWPAKFWFRIKTLVRGYKLS